LSIHCQAGLTPKPAAGSSLSKRGRGGGVGEGRGGGRGGEGEREILGGERRRMEALSKD